MTTKMMVTLGLVLSIAWIPIVGTILALQHHGVASLARRAIDAATRLDLFDAQLEGERLAAVEVTFDAAEKLFQ